ncbi:hypothetical protein BJ508DRAFT_327691 [Ascobolus immersus RN42]|uniref:Uncharacterized protein n=1 Tax=Ascobolus immersus RN42 TaxID=1160509 RepID=A0A3N4I1P3_ASCIM|nr:hypothetical protein BJ508DRAFT_327691 [Ascobolus immersus RN42]
MCTSTGFLCPARVFLSTAVMIIAFHNIDSFYEGDVSDWKPQVTILQSYLVERRRLAAKRGQTFANQQQSVFDGHSISYQLDGVKTIQASK